MERKYVPYGFDWPNVDEHSTAHCRGCNEDFSTYHCIRRVDGELVQFFSHLCPRCDSLAYVFGVSSPVERVVLRGD